MQSGYDAVWVRDWEPSAADTAVVRKALDEVRCIVTLDRDIPALVLRSEQAQPSVIRMVRLSTRAQIPALLEALKRHGGDLANGALMTVSPQNIRIRRLVR